MLIDPQQRMYLIDINENMVLVCDCSGNRYPSEDFIFIPPPKPKTKEIIGLNEIREKAIEESRDNQPTHDL